MRFMMKLWVLAFVFLVLIVARPAYAGSKYWKGPAWYMVYIGEVGIIIMGGPYGSEDACKQVLLPPDNGGKYQCDYLKYDIDDFEDFF